MNIEDETGMVNVICPPNVWQRNRRIALESTAVVVEGRLERLDGAISLGHLDCVTKPPEARADRGRQDLDEASRSGRP